jgi:hypothetical protein
MTIAIAELAVMGHVAAHHDRQPSPTFVTITAALGAGIHGHMLANVLSHPIIRVEGSPWYYQSWGRMSDGAKG